MTKINNKFARISTTLAAAVANNGTFTAGYPTGFSQLSFQKGLERSSGHVMIVNGNDRWTSANFTLSFGASTITITNTTGASLAAGSTIDLTLDVSDGVSRIPFTIPLPPLSTITAADIVTEMYPGIEGTIEYWEFVSTIAVTTASKLATLNLEIDTTNVTGGDLALTSALLTPKGTVIGAVPTGANVLTRESKLSVEASSVTAFVEGEGYLVVYIRPNQADVY